MTKDENDKIEPWLEEVIRRSDSQKASESDYPPHLKTATKAEFTTRVRTNQQKFRGILFWIIGLILFWTCVILGILHFLSLKGPL
jgi:hypothetical protein